MADEIELREALDDMIWQFAYRTRVDGRRALTTGGLSALEHAFGILGWDDPHYVDDDATGCEIEGCGEWATCVGPYPRSRATAKASANPKTVGFGYLCSKHYCAWSGIDKMPADDLGRVT